MPSFSPSGQFKSTRNSKQISVSELQIGMFVSKLDRDWLDTPFIFQGFLVETLDDIEVLTEYCQHVWIDAVEESWHSNTPLATLPATRSTPRYINKIQRKTDHRLAIGAYKAARRITKTLLEEARLGTSINIDNARETVTACVNSILCNPDALVWMGRMRNQDEYTSEHCLNVCILSIAFGRHLGLNEAELNQLGLCGLLHDVGKMRVPPAVLNKPGRLTEKEFNMIKAHATHGRNLLMSSPGVYHGAVDVAYSHHERMDGRGYPRGLKAAGISYFARVVAITDAYDAMTSIRCYSGARPSTEALRIIRENAGSQFDEKLAGDFITLIGLYPPGSLVELTNGSVGIVLNTNYRYRHLPKVLIVLDQSKQPCTEKVVNLAETERGRLSHEYLIKQVLVDGSFNLFLRNYREKGLQLNY